uniref:Ig-like domain-containing protein n=1 Tax=Pseudonaja textilis TaxID=8673 RepID=A0A670Z239_PSETE
MMLVYFFLLGVFSDIQLVESGPGMARPGSQLDLVCKVTGFSIATSSSFAWNWIKQPPGKGTEWLSAINANTGGKWLANSVKGHATISADHSRNEFSLWLSSDTAADSPVYICARQHQFGLCTKSRWDRGGEERHRQRETPHTHTHTQRERERERERQRRDRETETERQRQRQTDTERNRDRPH